MKSNFRSLDHNEEGSEARRHKTQSCMHKDRSPFAICYPVLWNQVKRRNPQQSSAAQNPRNSHHLHRHTQLLPPKKNSIFATLTLISGGDQSSCQRTHTLFPTKPRAVTTYPPPRCPSELPSQIYIHPRCQSWLTYIEPISEHSTTKVFLLTGEKEDIDRVLTTEPSSSCYHHRHHKLC